MTMMNQLTYRFSFVLFVVLFFVSCVDDDFDAPPIDGEQPDIEANTTIAELKALHTIGNFEEVTEDIIVTGIVTADDRSGNFYQSITIQDSTAAIELRLNESDLFNEYGQGRQLYIKCNRLWLGDYNGTTQLGIGTELDDRGRTTLSQIPSALFDEHIVKGKWNFEVEPVVRTVNQLRQSDVSKLVRLENMQFALESCVRTYAIDYISPEGNRVQESLNQPLESCQNGATIVLRSSGYSSFSRQEVPLGSGSITAIYTVFGDTKQLVIRDTDDVDMLEDRCGDSGINGDLISIRDLRNKFTGSPLPLNENLKIRGVVISDLLNGNTNNRNVVIQDETAGIVVRFENGHVLGLGEIVEINVNNTELSEFDGLLQVMNTANEQAFSTCEIDTVAPRVATIQELFDNSREWESTLVKVEDARISGSATFSGYNTVTDVTNSIPMYTNDEYASFAGDLIPVGDVDVTGILSYDDGAQIYMRNRNDVVGGEIIEPDPISIAEVREMYEGSTTFINGNYQITGVVISDSENGNIHGLNLVLQDETAGIVVRFTDDHPYILGDELTIHVSGLELSEYENLLQINYVPLTAVSDIAAGTLPTPRIATTAEIRSNGEDWESTLVTIQDANITGSSNYSGNTTITDQSGTLAMYTRNDATFSNAPLPNEAVTITGYVSQFRNDYQLGLRNLDDVQ